MEDKSFDKMYWVLRKATHYMSVTYPLELVKLTPTDKLVYIFMLHRYIFFKGEYRDKQGFIAEECGLDIKTVNRCVKSFVDNGIMDIKHMAKYNVSYESIRGLSLYKNIKGTYAYLQDIEIPCFSKKQGKVPTPIKDIKITPPTPDIEPWDDDCPF